MTIKNNKYINMVFVLCFIVLAITCGGKKETPPPKQTTMKTEAESVKIPTETTATIQKIDSTASKPQAETPKEGKYMVISVKNGDKNLGKIKIELYTKEAPKTTENLKTLIKKGFYNGLTFHRVISGFMIQGGDPAGNGTGGPGYTTPAEISPTLKHIRGAVAMARQGDEVNPKRESSGSQFYICHVPTPFLDGKYTIVGQVVEGMDVVDKIAAVKTSPGDRPIVPVMMAKVTLE
jgi:cyclophilin family peptidyl-prolyl cis-trans isomerase